MMKVNHHIVKGKYSYKLKQNLYAILYELMETIFKPVVNLVLKYKNNDTALKHRINYKCQNKNYLRKLFADLNHNISENDSN